MSAPRQINARKGHQGFHRLPLEDRFWAKVEIGGPDECWHWTACSDAGGYGQFFLKGRGAGRGVRAHRIAWELTSGVPFPSGMQACHSCDNPSCCNPAHIWPGTPQENALDAVRKGRMKPNPPTKLDAERVREIRRLRASGERQVDVARRFGVRPETIRRIELGKTWGGVA